MVNEVFNVSVFFILFRETVEASIIISVLLAFLKQGIGRSSEDPNLHKKLVRQVWFGAALGLLLCLILGGAFIGAWYGLGKNVWGSSEDIWEGVFSLVAGIIISIMGLALLRVNKMKEKWRVKIARALEKGNGKKAARKFTTKYAMAILPFITVLREGIEAIVFTGGVSLSAPAKAFPLPVICGILAGSAVGYIIYKGGSYMRMQIFLIVSTCFLYLVAAGIMSRAVWYFEMYIFAKAVGGDVAETGSGPGSYDIRSSVWHVNCCNPNIDGGWMIFQALFGWQNSATYGSVLMYNIYWIAVMVGVVALLYYEKKGHYPFMKPKAKPAASPVALSEPIPSKETESV
ncbi:iron permease FTR1/Fip1/EfeU [Lipomyces tetrasporus]|uniref:Iron permease FTR1/Fip1/EfeU n=1 Tax=Lipomyces tetrasporus TaxID=54092 RepID=A0AAD7QP86_9ASCO|nr:iron permease FTR1/Fip1/EfeU [Lipomyces tetrasporus]KAJ8098778.1 iron permease FTR1/Fip1/EfeU [Lipomyces tetrasporus]